jgi:hypothetical protein
MADAASSRKIKLKQTYGGKMPVQGERIAGFILITGIDGIRYAVRQHAVSVLSDHDPAQDETCMLLHGGAVVRVPASLDEVLTWFA